MSTCGKIQLPDKVSLSEDNLSRRSGYTERGGSVALGRSHHDDFYRCSDWPVRRGPNIMSTALTVTSHQWETVRHLESRLKSPAPMGLQSETTFCRQQGSVAERIYSRYRQIWMYMNTTYPDMAKDVQSDTLKASPTSSKNRREGGLWHGPSCAEAGPLQLQGNVRISC